MNEMDQNEPSKGTEMNRNVPTRTQLTKISQIEGTQTPKWTKWGEINHRKELKWSKMSQQEPN